MNLIDRRDILSKDVVACPHCWEEVVWRPEASGHSHSGPGGRSTGWKHSRTGLVPCTPVCDACHEGPGEHAIGGTEYTGGMVATFVPRNFLCTSCRDLLRAEQLLIERT